MMQTMLKAAIKPLVFLLINHIKTNAIRKYKRIVSFKSIDIFLVNENGNRLVLSIIPFICAIRNPVKAPDHFSKNGIGLTSSSNNSAYKMRPDSGTTRKFVKRKRLGNW
jgi:hypothetical protein